jgi:hypothetical protein
MSGKPAQQEITRWLSEWALVGAAAICLIISILLAIFDRVAAGTLTAGLFVVCVLFHYLPQMESFKAFGIEAKWRVKESEEQVRLARAELENVRGELIAQIAADVPKEALVVTVQKVDKAITQLSTANNALSVALTALNLTTGSPELGKPTLGTGPKSD